MKYYLTIVLLALLASTSFAQKSHKPTKKPRFVVEDTVITAIHRLQSAGLWRFPVTDMWDDAMARARVSKKPVIIFDVDYVDSSSVGFHDRILKDPSVLVYLFENFELATNDFSVDPPPAVGFDSLRNLGRRLDFVEKGYGIAVRPTVLLLNPDSSEIERIPYPNLMTSEQFIDRVQQYLHGINTVNSLRKKFWSDTTNFAARKAYLNRLSERSEYDSVVYQLGVIAQMHNFGPESRDAAKQYAYLRMNVEGQNQYLRTWIAALGKTKQDSLDALQGLRDLLEFYQARKKIDSVAASYDHIFEFTGVRDPETLNNYAWDLATHSKRWDEALSLVDEAIAAKPKSADFYDTRALIYWSKQDFQDAVRDSEESLKYAKTKDDRAYFSDRVNFYTEQLKKSKEVKPDAPAPADSNDK